MSQTRDDDAHIAVAASEPMPLAGNGVLIDGLLRVGDILSIRGPTRGVAAWAAIKLAAAVGVGGTFLDRFQCGECRVLLTDKRSAPPDLIRRFLAVNGANSREALRKVDMIWHPTQRSFWSTICALQKDEFRVIILDSFDARFAANPAQTLALLWEHAARIGCAFVLVQHGRALGLRSQDFDSTLELEYATPSTLRALTTTRSWEPRELFEVSKC